MALELFISRRAAREIDHGRAGRNVEQHLEAGRAPEVRSSMQYLVVIERGPTSFGAYIPDLPGCVAVGSSREEVETLIHEAIEFHIEALLNFKWVDGHEG